MESWFSENIFKIKFYLPKTISFGYKYREPC